MSKPMREIKFRAWLKEYKNMVSVYEIVFTKKGASVRLNGFHYTHYRTFKHNEIILMQYTGLKDKNEKEIYERDIILIQKRTKFVEWHEETASWRLNFYDNQEFDKMSPIAFTRVGEIIGNIHENPELLVKPLKINAN